MAPPPRLVDRDLGLALVELNVHLFLLESPGEDAHNHLVHSLVPLHTKGRRQSDGLGLGRRGRQPRRASLRLQRHGPRWHAGGSATAAAATRGGRRPRSGRSSSSASARAPGWRACARLRVGSAARSNAAAAVSHSSSENAARPLAACAAAHAPSRETARTAAAIASGAAMTTERGGARGGGGRGEQSATCAHKHAQVSMGVRSVRGIGNGRGGDKVEHGEERTPSCHPRASAGRSARTRARPRPRARAPARAPIPRRPGAAPRQRPHRPRPRRAWSPRGAGEAGERGVARRAGAPRRLAARSARPEPPTVLL